MLTIKDNSINFEHYTSDYLDAHYDPKSNEVELVWGAYGMNDGKYSFECKPSLDDLSRIIKELTVWRDKTKKKEIERIENL